MTSPRKSQSTLRRVECKRCGGWGWFVLSKRMCPTCYGSGKVRAAAKAKRGKRAPMKATCSPYDANGLKEYPGD